MLPEATILDGPLKERLSRLTVMLGVWRPAPHPPRLSLLAARKRSEVGACRLSRDREHLKASEHDGLLEGRVLHAQTDLGKPLQHQFQSHAYLQPSQRGSQAVMNAATE